MIRLSNLGGFIMSKHELDMLTQHQESVTSVGIEASIPGYKIRFFVDRKTISDTPITQEIDHDARKDDGKAQEREDEVGRKTP